MIIPAILGLGYVGLTLAAALAQNGISVVMMLIEIINNLVTVLCISKNLY